MKPSSIGWLWLAGAVTAIGVVVPDRPVTVAPGAGAILIFDITQSMNVKDVSLAGEPVSRLELARESALYTLENMPCGTALGTGIFAAHRTLLLSVPVEVCQHRGELRQAIEFIGPAMAWHGNSEVAKAYYASLKIAASIADKPAVVFLTDGHEAPPVSPLHRPRFDEPAGRAAALIAGFGGNSLVAIPKSDPSGRPIGFWSQDEVLQIDRYKTGRGGSTKGEAMVELDNGVVPDKRVGGTPGREHLSSLRETYLRLLAGETDAHYAKISNPQALTAAIESVLQMPGLSALDSRKLCAALALVLLTIYFVTRLLGRPSR